MKIDKAGALEGDDGRKLMCWRNVDNWCNTQCVAFLSQENKYSILEDPRKIKCVSVSLLCCGRKFDKVEKE